MIKKKRIFFFFFSWSLSWWSSCFLVFLIAFLVEFLFSCCLTFLFSFINSHLCIYIYTVTIFRLVHMRLQVNNIHKLIFWLLYPSVHTLSIRIPTRGGNEIQARLHMGGTLRLRPILAPHHLAQPDLSTPSQRSAQPTQIFSSPPSFTVPLKSNSVSIFMLLPELLVE